MANWKKILSNATKPIKSRATYGNRNAAKQDPNRNAPKRARGAKKGGTKRGR